MAKTHKARSSHAGRTVTLSSGQAFTVADWFDRVTGMTWQEAAERGDAAAVNYAMRVVSPGQDPKTADDDVVIGFVGLVPYLAHASELE